MSTREIIIAVFGAILMGFVWVFKKYSDKFKEMADKTETSADNVVLYIANLVVPLIEKTFSNEKGEIKKEKAMGVLASELTKVGVKASTDVLSEAVEQAVVNMKVQGQEEKKQVVEK